MKKYFKRITNLFKARESIIERRISNSFFSPYYQQHNVARLNHLDSLALALNNKKVIEFGAGVGDHTFFYLTKNCEIIPTEGREDLVKIIRKRFSLNALTIDGEKDVEKIKGLPPCDIIHCYGFLYHINKPDIFLNSINKIGKTLLLETCVSANDEVEAINLVLEKRESLTQAISGQGCRPSRSWVYNKLKQLYPYVYLPKTQPKHPEFPINWNNLNSSENTLTRAVFIASHEEIISDKLTNSLVRTYESW